VQYASGEHETGVQTLQQRAVSIGITQEVWRNAWQLHQAEQFAQAQQQFEAMLSFAQDNYAEYIQWGDEAYQRGDLNTAESCFRHVLNARPNYADVRNRLGVVLVAQGRDEEAVEQFIAELRVNPNYVEAHVNLAITYYELGFTDQAKAHYKQVLAITPDNRVAREALQQLAA
jgi:tetratricopeptide (TPR) repeat protein